MHVPWYTGPGTGGTAFPVTYDFSGVTVPDTVIFGVAFNTQSWGASPIGVPGPYVSLNYGVAQVPPTIGSYVNPNNAYIAIDGGSFSEDIGGWSPYGAAIQVNVVHAVVPEPSTAAMAVAGLALFGWHISRQRQSHR